MTVTAARYPGDSAWFTLHRRLREGHIYSSTEVLVAFAVAGFIGRTRVTPPVSIRKLAAVTGLNERTVRETIKRHLARETPLFARAGAVDVGMPKKCYCYRLTIEPDSVGRMRNQDPGAATSEDTDPSVDAGRESTTTDRAFTRAGAGSEYADRRPDSDRETLRNKKRQALGGLAPRFSPQPTEWLAECNRLHGGECGTFARHQYLLKVEAMKRELAREPHRGQSSAATVKRTA